MTFHILFDLAQLTCDGLLLLYIGYWNFNIHEGIHHEALHSCAGFYMSSNDVILLSKDRIIEIKRIAPMHVQSLYVLVYRCLYLENGER